MVKTTLMIKSDYLKYLKKQEVYGKPIVDKIGKLNKFYLPLSEWIYSIYSKDFKTKIIGLSGGQGAGKSTILNLFPRFYDCEKGQIKIDNQSIYKVSLKFLRVLFDFFVISLMPHC